MASAGSGAGGGVEASSRRRNSAEEIDGVAVSGEFGFAIEELTKGAAACDIGPVRIRAEKSFWCSLNNRRSWGEHVKSKRDPAAQ